jgi:hypothetical protein
MRAQSLLLALAALVVGGFVGFLIGAGTSGGDGPRGPVHVADDLPERRVGDSTPQPRAPSPSTTGEVQTPADTEPGPAATRGDLSAWIESVEIPEVPTGESRIWGRATADGEPVAGATIRAQLLPRGEHFAGGDFTLEEEAAQAVRRRRYIEQSRVEARTDANGRYELTGLADQIYRVAIEADGYEPESGVMNAVRADTEVNFRLHRVGYLTLDVRLPDGEQPERAEVTFAVGPATRRQQWQRSAPELRVIPGSYSVKVVSGLYESEGFSVRIRAGEREHATVNLRRYGSIQCLFTTDGPAPASLPPAQVHLIADPPSSPPTAVSGFGQSIRLNASTSFTSLEPGRYRVVLTINREIVDWKDVDVADEPVRVEFKYEPDAGDALRPEDYVPVRVLGPDGAAPDNVRFSIHLVQDGRRSLVSPEIIRREPTLYWIVRPDGFRSGEGRVLTIQVSTNEFGSLQQEYRQTDTHEILIRFQEPATLTVNIPDGSSHPHRSELTLYLLPDGLADSRINWIRTPGRTSPVDDPVIRDSNVFTPLQPGKFTLVLTAPYNVAPGSANRHYARETIEIRPGENTHTLNIPRLYRLTLTPGQGEMPDHVRVRDDGQLFITVTLGSGPVDVGLLLPGHYQIVTGNAGMRVNLTGDMTVTVALETFCALQLARIEPGDRAHDMGLRDGDMLVAVNGNDPEDAQKLRELIRETAMNEASRWTVIRNGVYVDVVINGPAMATIRAEHGIRLSARHRE